VNILFYCSEYPPFRSGGIGSVTKIVAEELALRGHRVVVAGYYFDLPRTQIVETINNVTIYRFGLGIRNGALKQRFVQLCDKLRLSRRICQYEVDYIESQIERLVREFSIDVLEMIDYYPLVGCSSKLRFRKFSVPTVLRIHGSMTFIHEMAGACPSHYKVNDQLHFNRCDYVLAVSKFSLDFVRERFDLPNVRSWDVIYNLIEDKFVNHTEHSSNNTILFMGRLTKEKGCVSLMKAFNLCAAKDETLRLKLLGSGDKQMLLQYLDPRFHNRVEFVGYCDRAKVIESIDQCSFGCIPSYFENFSMAILEIFSRCRTVVFTNRASGAEIINDGVNGFAVDPDNIEQLSERVLQLASNHALRDEMAERAFEDILTKYKANVVVNQLESYYASKING
jgi:glycosyltransferase involved in cell wall biosynthesis